MKTSDEWYTPAEIIQSLGEFDLDPASSEEAYRQNRSAKHFYTVEEDGLNKDWHGRVWLNPPYSNPLIQQFLVRMAEHNNGIALVFAKVEAKWFHDIVLRRSSSCMTGYGSSDRTARKAYSRGTAPCWLHTERKTPGYSQTIPLKGNFFIYKQ